MGLFCTGSELQAATCPNRGFLTFCGSIVGGARRILRSWSICFRLQHFRFQNVGFAGRAPGDIELF